MNLYECVNLVEVCLKLEFTNKSEQYSIGLPVTLYAITK